MTSNVASAAPRRYRLNRYVCLLALVFGQVFLGACGKFTDRSQWVAADEPVIPSTPPAPPRTDVHISGVYPHLTVYGVYSQNGAHYKSGHNECGIGAIVPWAGKLWMVNYAPHQPTGSEHKLYSIDPDLTQPLTIHPESVGGTPAGRMIHPESQQLLIAHYAIDQTGKVRAISPADMPIRVTAIARHLTDPANLVYYIDMEGSIWEANVHTLAVTRLFKKPVPGWHGKGGYTSQGRLVISNNGELHVGDYRDVLVGGPAKSEEERGVLAEYDGKEWRIIERRQFTEVTGPRDITGGSDGDDPIWTMGWDRRSVRLKVLDGGKWFTYLLPKAAMCNDASHGWYTEWPRIREITGGRWMMDMHGMFFDFPKSFTHENSAGIRPIGSHLRYIPDFCGWNGQVVLGTDETSIQGNPLAGQPQTNLWFGDYEDLKQWGPASGMGGPWLDDFVAANTPSEPFLIAGFDRRVVHLGVGRKQATAPIARQRATDQQRIHQIPTELERLPLVTVQRGDWHKPAAGFSFQVDQDVTVYLAVDKRGNPQLDPAWQTTDMQLHWGTAGYSDAIYQRKFAAGTVVVPSNSVEHVPGSFGMPHAAFVLASDPSTLEIIPSNGATVTQSQRVDSDGDAAGKNVTFTLQVDRAGNDHWTDLTKITVPDEGNVIHYLPNDLDAVWLRFQVDRECLATAFLYQSTESFVDGSERENQVTFRDLADVDEAAPHAAVLYAAKRNRDLRVITSDDRYFDFGKADFAFHTDEPDTKLKELLSIEPEFTVDEASVVLRSEGRTMRLPKGDPRFDKPFAWGWPRGSREVESERHLANIHGTFYEVPLITNGRPPAFHLMRPVSSHRKQISDFCTWNGLLVLAGVSGDARQNGLEPGGHVFADPKQDVAIWFGGIDDLWKLGKPVGRGGPWMNSQVQAGQPSDAYLMKGYDRKTLRLSHQSDTMVSVTIEVDITGEGHWHRYDKISVAAGETAVHEFPAAFQAAWVRLVSDTDTTATGQFLYE
ncbi:hypothetical protein [Stieleria varia]|uniref:Uncharacterized protein n=1 Tax=Stieleria varia TaxID=2528005 RepID=A0A5C6AYQ3_9BACT|nr:hypothetical protein [Stieleria varia]TWU04289.1 hypothetical protein Pla52n_23280 [Stieleria varia]